MMRVSIESGVGGMDGTLGDESSVNPVKGGMIYLYGRWTGMKVVYRGSGDTLGWYTTVTGITLFGWG